MIIIIIIITTASAYDCASRFLRNAGLLAQIINFFEIKPTLGEWPSGFRNSRKEEVVLSWLRIGHTYFSHSHILRKEDPPECTACQEIYSVRHVLIDCIDLGIIRPRFYSVPDLKTLFESFVSIEFYHL